MKTIIFLLVLSTQLQLGVPAVTSVNLVKAKVELVSGDSRIFSGESVRLKCSIINGFQLTWSYRWFRGSKKLPQTGEHLLLWNAGVTDSGKFYCQGVRDSMVGDIYTLKSMPVEINVDGGWAILKVPPHLNLVGDTLEVTCRVRGEPQLHGVILYKNGVEVMSQVGANPTFNLLNLTLEDRGMYSCRASWDAERRTRSVISAQAPLQVVEALSQPVLEIVVDNNLIPAKNMKLICHLEYNVPAPAPPVHYYFYEGDNQLGTATSENYHQVKRTPGQYRCRAKVPQLGIIRWSEPKSFGQVTGPKMMMPPIFNPRDPWPLDPRLLSPDSAQPPASEPTTAQPSPHRSTETSTFIQPADVSTQSSDFLMTHSQPAPSTLSPTLQPVKQTAIPEPLSINKESGGIFEGSGDISEGSGDMPEGSGDMPEGSGDMPEGSGDMPKGSGNMLE